MNLISIVIPVFRDRYRAVKLANSIFDQTLDAGLSFEVIVVDDGSGDDTADWIEQKISASAKLLRLPTNSGRSAARNAGAATALGEMLLFIDCDCEPVGQRFIQSHISTIRQHAIASIGPVVGDGDGFWDRYQVKASLRRFRSFKAGATYSGSTQNLAVTTASFLSVGGFCEEYRRYGFEDRDLLIRLSLLGKVHWTEHAIVRHLDKLTLVEVSRKMKEAGGSSAEIFSRCHPDAYRQLGYAVIDTRLHPALRPLAATVAPVLPKLARIGDIMINWKWLPYRPKAVFTKLLTAVSFSCGTLRGSISTDV